MRGVSVGPLLFAAAGIVLVWSAIHGANVTSTFRDLLAHREY